jgi:membrane-bound ClpP family serine protease
MRTSQNKSNLTIAQMVDRIVASGKLARREHLILTSAILSDDKISDEERYQINRVFDYIQIGRLNFID